MTNYEMVELLRQKANVSYEEAKAALEAADWDLLDAIVLLEREGKVPENDARFSTKAEEKAEEPKKKKERDGAFRDGARTVGGIFRRMLNYGNRNYIVASRDGKEVVSLPLTAFVLLLLIPPITIWLMLVLLIIGLLCYTVFVYMDRKFDRQLIAAGELKEEKSADEEFHVSDLKYIFGSKMFWLVALLCVLYYSAIFPFQRYAPNFLEVTLGIDAESAARLFSCFPILAMVLTPFLGALLDFRGKGATMLMVGAVIMIACHLSFAFLLPAFPSKWLALLLVVTLGVSFSLVPAALWPSVPKIIDAKILGSAYCLIFWIQNVGLCLVPLLIGKVLDATGGYTVPMIIFSSFGVLAFIFSFYLKIEDRRKNYGLEKPNII